MTTAYPESESFQSDLTLTAPDSSSVTVFDPLIFDTPAQIIAALEIDDLTFNSLMDNLDKPVERYCLFLDIDGTLAELCDDPAQSFVPAATLKCIETLYEGGLHVVAVTGRDVPTALQLLSPLKLPVAGLHGLDILLDESTHIKPTFDDIDFAQLKQQLQQACAAYPALLIEDKAYSFALHYRQCPELAEVALHIMQQLQADYPQLKLGFGKCVIEILPKQADKGNAIAWIMQQPLAAQRKAIFIGDDITDESGFALVNALGGLSIKVGSGPTQAHYRLPTVATVADFLTAFSTLVFQH
ncbi:MAG: trehalose-phosphatase [Moraxellaceae bacterium]|nr:MAG: trehalose-phosphatase [Moraxellaceae bacterium]